jgi:hypothetical protein
LGRWSCPPLAEKACFISYSGFEEKVAHLDIETCPGAQMKAEEGFCRIGLDGSAVLVYTFRHTDAEPAWRAWTGGVQRLRGRFGSSYDKP